jgi:hypothetical protein
MRNFDAGDVAVLKFLETLKDISGKERHFLMSGRLADFIEMNEEKCKFANDFMSKRSLGREAVKQIRVELAQNQGLYEAACLGVRRALNLDRGNAVEKAGYAYDQRGKRPKRQMDLSGIILKKV